MKIVHVLRKYNPAEWGGVESHLYDLSKYLLSQGHQITIFAPTLQNGTHQQQDPFVAIGAVVRRFNAFLPASGLSQSVRKNLHALGGNLFSLDLLPRLLAEKEVNAIHTHALNRIGGIAALAAKIRRVPLLLSIHGGYTDLPSEIASSMTARHYGGLDLGKPLGWLVRSRHVVDDAARIFVFNQIEQARLASDITGTKVTLFPHAVAKSNITIDAKAIIQEHFPKLVGRRFLLSVSRINPAKQQHLLIEAYVRLAESNPDLILVFAGSATDPQYAKQLATTVAENRLESKVLFTGNLPSHSTQLAALYQEASIFILSSRHEPLGIVILEAWAASLPVVATRTSGASELIQDGENGLLVEQEAAAITTAVQQLLDNDDLCANITSNALVHVRQKHSRKLMGELYLSSLQAIGNS